MTGAFSAAFSADFDTVPVPPPVPPVATGIRQDIADTLAKVTIDWNGEPHPLDGQPYRPATLSVWQAFPEWTSARWLSACVIEQTWSVLVILPGGDVQAWSSALDASLDTVREALFRLGNVSRVEPVTLVVAEQSTTLPALAFTLIT